MMLRTSSNPIYADLATAVNDLAGYAGLVIDSPVSVSGSGELTVEVPVVVEPGGQIRIKDDRTADVPKTITLKDENDVSYDVPYTARVSYPKLTFAGPFTAPPIRIFVREAGWGGTVVFGDGGRAGPDGLITEAVFVTPSWWENGTVDDTDAVQTALGYNRVRFTRTYRVTSVTASMLYQIIDMAGFFLTGIAATAADAVLTLRNWREGRIFNAGVISDGDKTSPIYALNYRCALRCKSEDVYLVNKDGQQVLDKYNNPININRDATQYGYIDGLRIRNMKTGIVWGAHDGDAPQPRYPQSEFHIHGYSPVGVMVPFVGNALNAYLQFHDSIFVAQRTQASASWWDDAAGRTLVNRAGLVRLIGGSIQRAVTAGYNLWGGGIVVENCDVERACSDYLTGDVTYRSCRNGHYGWPNVFPVGWSNPIPFKVAPGATGRLLLDDVVIRRDDGVVDRSLHNLVDASQAPDYEIVFRDTTVHQWRIDSTDQAAYFVHGGRMTCTDLAIDNSTAQSYRLREGPNRLVLADPTGRSMPITDDLTSKGHWASVGYGQGGFYKATSDLPMGANEAIRIHATTTGVEIQTDAPLAVESGYDHVVDFWLKYTGAASGYFRIYPRWIDADDHEFKYFDQNGQPIRTPPVATQTGSVLATNGFTSWLRFRAVASAPLGAVKARFSFFLGAGADLMVTDIRVI
ncbi:hypothetical protein [Inquilinus limosus]|uniref:Uncharacterized protein n=1 Tax=Inquilinus limosus TaxID=171674 RepID=A0A211ZTX5_9PROT|nr:hypothetical protein [Inquilinus limosus]OWJ68715.1 hypothetical protein BWR60_02905 [Inquilinus limosus]